MDLFLIVKQYPVTAHTKSVIVLMVLERNNIKVRAFWEILQFVHRIKNRFLIMFRNFLYLLAGLVVPLDRFHSSKYHIITLCQSYLLYYAIPSQY
ncbi:uncharacterized protein Dvar_36090 [Desulfosarcina variabilis str. Montpellier]